VKTYQAFLKTSQNAPVWSGVIDKVEAPDERTLKFTLKAPFSPFLITHASTAEGCWFVPAETIDNDQVKKDPVGTGPFIFDKFDSGVAISGHKNPTYYDAPLPNFDKIEAALLGDPQRIIAALQSGDFDWSLLSGSLYKESRSKLDSKGTDIYPADSNQTAFYFNFDNKPFNDVRVRQALSMALDRDGYLKTQDGTGKGNWRSFLAPNVAPFYVSPRDNASAYGANAKYFQRNIADAKALLKAATGSDTLQFKLYANVNAYGAAFQQRWEAFASTIKDAGFNAELTYVDYGTVYTQTIYLGKIPEGCAVGPLIAVARDPDDMFMRCYWSKSARHNWGGTPIPEMADLDAMFEKQRTILDTKERLKFVQDIQVKMAESFLVIPTQAPAGWAYAGPSLQNFYYKSSYANLVDATMKANFTDERLKKG
jgi:peptide/nickel transport system substrate-binding protein